MKDPVIRRWIFLGALWLLAGLLTSLNATAALKITEARLERGIRREIISFFDDHEELMDRTSEQIVEYALRIPSYELGMLTIEELLFKASAGSGIRSILTEFKTRKEESSSIRLKLVFSSTAHNGFRFLEQLKTEHPFLAFESFMALSNREMRVIDFLLDLHVKTELIRDPGLEPDI